MHATEWIPLLLAGLTVILLVGCAAPAPTPHGRPEISRHPFGTTDEGISVDLYVLKNSNGLEAHISNFGGILVSMEVPDRNGQLADVVLGFDELKGYLAKHPYFGAIIGRYGNRIAKGKFTLGGKEYSLPINNGPNSLHGGARGFDKKVWEPHLLATTAGPSLELTYVSKDGEEGYPGNLSVRAIYSLSEDNELKLEFTAATDKETVVNLTQHSYFNLSGEENVLKHVVMINADKFTPTDKFLIPTGELRNVSGTVFDFRQPATIGARINDDDEQLKLAGGYDHNWVINKPAGSLGLCARVVEPSSGRILEVLSTQPGMQFYSGNFLDGTLTGKGGRKYNRRHGFCLEPEHFPDSPNHPEFPSTVLKPGQVYKETIIFRFSTQK
jgi:aldose 1-epimerase